MRLKDLIDNDLVREALGRRGLTFADLVERLDVSDRRALSTRLQNMRRAGLVELRGTKWHRANRSVTPQVARGSRNGRAKLSRDDVLRIRALAERDVPWVAIAMLVGTTPENCQMIAQRRRWAWVN